MLQDNHKIINLATATATINEHAQQVASKRIFEKALEEERERERGRERGRDFDRTHSNWIKKKQTYYRLRSRIRNLMCGKLKLLMQMPLSI